MIHGQADWAGQVRPHASDFQSRLRTEEPERSDMPLCSRAQFSKLDWQSMRRGRSLIIHT